MTAPGGRVALGCAIVLWTSSLTAQTRGRVHDSESLAGVAGAWVAWFGTVDSAGLEQSGRAEGRKQVVTDESGAFLLAESWGPGGVLRIRAPGYHPRALTWEEAESAAWRIALDRDPVALDGIVVTVAGRPRNRSEVAVPIETVSLAEIEASGAQSIDRLLAELPGVHVAAGTPTGSNLLIRGIGGARVLVLVDGRPVPGALIENRDLSRISLAGAERVEVVKGPLSSLYGSDALGGVVNVITAPPASGFGLDGRAFSGGAGRKEADLTASGGGRLRYRATGAWRQEDRIPGVLTSADDEGFARVWDLRSEFGYDASAMWDLGGGASFLRERQRWPVGGGFSGFNDNRGVSGWLEARRKAGPGDWTVGVFAQDYEHLYRSARGDAPIASPGDAPQREREARLSAAYSATAGAHRFDAGIEGSRRMIRSPDKLIEERVGDGQVAVFGQDAWRLGRATVTGGARFSWNSRWGANLSPALGVSGSPREGLQLRAVLARGFRAPSFKELAWHFVNPGAGYVLQGFPDLAAEHSWNASGGVEWSPRPGIRIDAEIYSNAVENLIEPGFVGNTPSGLLVYSPRNVAEVTTRGFEFRVGAFSHWGALVAGYAYLDARSADSDTPLDRRPRHSARVRGSWVATAPAGLRLDLTAHMTGEAPILGSGPDGGITRVATQEQFAAVDLQARVDLWRGLALSGGVDNLFDARPKGWQGRVERRFRVGLAVRELFRE
ncbi:MAG: TonB-dependent receptor [Gemmatimonadetes bacterium]|nr:TonB-dependent receptor [Gemmatimonadota bacterium]MYD13235.1 TonB-dependent receptor [Gemmatimonadota bacterium]